MKVEVTTRRATTVNSLQQAFEFVMDSLDKVGERPTIAIAPEWWYEEDQEPVQKFGVMVEGEVEEPRNEV